jgi:hypothetical protein
MDDRHGREALKQTGKETVITCGSAGEAIRWFTLRCAGNDRCLLNVVGAAVFGNNPVYHQVVFSPDLLFPLQFTYFHPIVPGLYRSHKIISVKVMYVRPPCPTEDDQ